MMLTPWADQPFSLLNTNLPENHERAHPGSAFVFTAMCMAHNMMLRHLNSIYLQATGVKQPSDIGDFLFYCKAWAHELQLHHAGEEEKLFPMLDNFTGVKGIMAKSEDEHHAFMDGVEKFCHYVDSIPPSEYDGSKLREIIDGFSRPLLNHLREEPLALLDIGEQYGGAGFKVVWDRFEGQLVKEAIAKGDKHVLLPLALGLNDHNFEGGAHANWPPFPFFVPFLTRVYFARKNAGVWRFCPCWNFKRRELSFVGPGWQDSAALGGH